MDFVHFIVEEGLIMIAVLYVLGEIIARTHVIANNFIPVVLLFVSIILTPLIIGGYTGENMVQAILVVGVTVFGDQLYKQIGRVEKA